MKRVAEVILFSSQRTNTKYARHLSDLDWSLGDDATGKNDSN